MKMKWMAVAVVALIVGSFALGLQPGDITGWNFTVYVKDKDTNQGIGGAIVRLTPSGGATHIGTTSPSGMVVFPSVEEGTASITISAAGYQNWNTHVEIGEDSTSCTALLDADGPPAWELADIYGWVIDARNGLGIGGATVTGAGTTVSAAGGSYRIEDVAPGEYTLTASATGYEPQELNVEVAQTNLLVDFRLEFAGTNVDITFVYTNNPAQVIVGPQIVMTLSTGWSQSTVNGELGLVIPPGAYTYSVSTAKLPQPVTGSLMVGSVDMEITIPLYAFVADPDPGPDPEPTTGTLKGSVVWAADNGNFPINGAKVTVGSASTFTDSNGEYSIDIAPGVYTVSVTATGFNGDSGTATVTADQTTTLDFDLEKTSPDPGPDPEPDVDEGDMTLYYIVIALPFIVAAVAFVYAIRRRK
jgi:hypothetical protein